MKYAWNGHAVNVQIAGYQLTMTTLELQEHILKRTFYIPAN